ncbi:MAG: 3-phosphoserine/phosphohydroxythreonine transaminase [Bacteroidales bacterium]|nr:3-phosphoserine/phosphohydroxythreonine transaminase [Bacteroidales bacterium]
MKKHIFNPGPAVLPEFTIKNTASAVMNFNDTGMSIMEISHRSKDFESVLNEAVALFRDILDIPAGYSVLFLHGGASLQFVMIPYNFLNKKAAYLDSGSWASKAIKEAKLFGDVQIVASSKEQNYTFLPSGYTIPEDADYFHITTNNTIFGTEIKKDIDSPVPLVADASSDILSRPMDVSKYGLIYGGAQKNLGPSGVAFAIVKESMLEKVSRPVPSLLNYKIHVDNNSLFNTPPCLAIYTCLQTLKWLKDLGGLQKIHKINLEKSGILYDEIERNKLFMSPLTNSDDRSIMNVVFVLKPEYAGLQEQFLELAKTKGIIGIKGHRSVGGFRASIYNALSLDSVKVLVDAMKEFETKV